MDIKQKPMGVSELPSDPREVVGSDIFVFEHELYLLMLFVNDYYSKWIEVILIATQTSNPIISVIKRTCSDFGIPRVACSDNELCCGSNVFRNLCEPYGVQAVNSNTKYS